MQTFLPFPDYAESVGCLDSVRLQTQGVEAWQLLQTLLGRSTGFDRHPAVGMWRGHEASLASYGVLACLEMRDRGLRDGLLERFADEITLHEPPRPRWLGDERLHSAHRRSLLTKDPAHYGRLGWIEEPWPDKASIRYWWPS